MRRPSGGCHEAYYSGGVARRSSAQRRQRRRRHNNGSAVSAFYLRRAASDIARASLPPKTVHIVCCRMVDEQREAYEEACELGGGALATIKKLRAYAQEVPLETRCTNPQVASYASPSLSSNTSARRDLKGVVASEYGDVGRHPACCDARRWDWLRVDGTTPPAERPRLVENLNRDLEASVFLLSTRAGGCGLNLVGGSRLLCWIRTGTRRTTSRPRRASGATAKRKRPSDVCR